MRNDIMATAPELSYLYVFLLDIFANNDTIVFL